MNQEQVIVHVQQRDREHDGRRDRLVQVLILKRDVRDQSHDRPLNHGETRHRETTLHVGLVFCGLGCEHFGLLVSGHFYYVQRN